MANRPYKNVKRFVDGVSKDAKNTMHKEEETVKETQTETPTETNTQE